MGRHLFVASVLALVFATAVGAQTASSGTSTGQSPSTQQSTSTPPPAEETRPATTTFLGDTGLWFVPTAEVLARGKWSVSGYRRGTNYIQGYTNVGDFAGTVAVGIGDRAEVFTSFLVDTRIDRDVRPIFVAGNTEVGSFVDRNPRVNQIWTGDNVGDWFIGGKMNVLSEYRQQVAALAVRGVLKVPTGDEEVGASTGATDFFVDFIGSKDIRGGRTEIAGYAGYEWRGEPEGYETPGGAFRWGAGLGTPTRGPVRFNAELNGLVVSDDTATRTATLIGTDGSVAPLTADVDSITRATLGVNYQARSGFFLGTGVSWNLPTEERVEALSENRETPGGDYWDWQFRIGYHPGVRVYVPPPPPPPPAPPPPAPVVHNLTVDAQCNPCTVEIGQMTSVTATVQSSIGCMVTYAWKAPSGTFANATAQQTMWTASQQEGTVPVTVTVTCPSDKQTASDTVNIQVVRPTPKVYTFEDVHFDFDRYSLRPEATRVLDEAVTALQADPTLRIQVEGHTCNIGTAEYNLALGDRRATAVRDYLTSRGVPAARLTTVSYGEERPRYDNAREETRRLNRRAVLTVNLQK
jgi:outer membrane protein OmpA-like peptidoglycan-associated protein